MNVKIYSSDLNDMMKVVGKCVQHDVPSHANVELIHNDNTLTIRASNGIFYAEASTPAMGGDGESICLDGKMLSDVAGKSRGEIEISSSGNVCTIKGVGRIKLPVVQGNVSRPEPVTGQSVTVDGNKFSACYRHVRHAVSMDETRIILTGALTVFEGMTMKMAALDGFQLSVEEAECSPVDEPVRMVIPGKFLDLVDKSMCTGNLTLTTDGKAVEVRTDSLLLRCGLLQGEYVAYERMLPEVFLTECRVRRDKLVEVLRTGRIVGSNQNLVKLHITEESITIQSNSEKADYEAQVESELMGDEARIAFNETYLSNALNAIDTDECVICCNTPTNPAVIKDGNMRGIRLVLPVRVVE